MGEKCQLSKGTFLCLKTTSNDTTLLLSLHPYIYIRVCVFQTKSLSSIFRTVYIHPSLKIKISTAS